MAEALGPELEPGSMPLARYLDFRKLVGVFQERLPDIS